MIADFLTACWALRWWLGITFIVAWCGWLPVAYIVGDILTRRWDREAELAAQEAARIHAAQDAARARLIADLTNLGERVRAQAEWDAYWESVVREPTPLHDELSAQMLRAELDDPQAVAMWLGGAS
jgi:hypothetical protein